MSAVCVYTMGNIEKLFNDSPFKGANDNNKDRLRMVRFIQAEKQLGNWVLILDYLKNSQSSISSLGLTLGTFDEH